MSVKITVTLSEREANAFSKAKPNRGRPLAVTEPLETADLKILCAILDARDRRSISSDPKENQND